MKCPPRVLADEERRQYAHMYKGDMSKVYEEAIARGIEKHAVGKDYASNAVSSVVSRAVSMVDRLAMFFAAKASRMPR